MYKVASTAAAAAKLRGVSTSILSRDGGGGAKPTTAGCLQQTLPAAAAAPSVGCAAVPPLPQQLYSFDGSTAI
jgi:hypothetical protein